MPAGGDGDLVLFFACDGMRVSLLLLSCCLQGDGTALLLSSDPRGDSTTGKRTLSCC